MFTDEQKRKIQEEEYRSYLRKHYAQQLSPKPLWSFLNSPFGLWLLSAVLVSGLSFVVTRWVDYRDAVAASDERSAEIHMEVGQRTAMAHKELVLAMSLHRDGKLQPDELNSKLESVRSILFGDRSFHRQFAEIAISALVHELQRSDSETGGFRYNRSLVLAREIAVFVEYPDLGEISRFEAGWCNFIKEEPWQDFVPESSRAEHVSCIDAQTLFQPDS
ncbi:MAG: hypothetical protein AAF756_22135 [Pseudomonadota bacterium]